MAITELQPELVAELTPPKVDESVNQYSVELDSPLIKEYTKFLVDNFEPYIDSESNPHIISNGRDYRVYRLSSSDSPSIISRSIEGSVIASDWAQDPAQTKDEALVYEDNSIFFLVIDASDADNPVPAASLRIADCIAGGSETIEFFKYDNGITDDSLLPEGLKVSPEDEDNGLWDIVGVMAPREYRDGFASAWAYHALYKSSNELGVKRWISNIIEKEYANLSSLGIPFLEIQGTEKAALEVPGKGSVLFGFYSAKVDDIRLKMEDKISDLEGIEDGSREFYMFIAKLARIALNGKHL